MTKKRHPDGEFWDANANDLRKKYPAGCLKVHLTIVILENAQIATNGVLQVRPSELKEDSTTLFLSQTDKSATAQVGTVPVPDCHITVTSME